MSGGAIPAACGLKAFAAIAGFKPSYITQLKKDGRLVLTPDGRQVRVAESLARIKETRDPSKEGVANRHAAARALPPAPPPEAPERGDDDTGAIPADPAPGTGHYQEARAKREHYLALAAQRDYMISMRDLLPAGEVEAYLADAATQLRARLEGLAVLLAPQLAAERDEHRCRAIVADAVERVLHELERQFLRISADEGAKG
ncbi:hypothetical protein JN531_012675 [Flagellatimonas centrodinii]|uniref:hypothetical protein n=1 Tax=Flagellatimonas centrodinii TaxID=2806210 RepID=UPI001FEDA7D8|nr:hypothetical protein [Flagellatimonas centrodinii]ULQ45954.1 hypothetical protein JN531_012675 [Flagellatimonas centrodinii]